MSCLAVAEVKSIERKRMNMNKTVLGTIGAIPVIVVVLWLLGGSRISCHESFWDKNKQVIEIKH